jgi:hypothetical protein
MSLPNDELYEGANSTEPQDPVYSDDPLFNFRSGNFSLEYKKFVPFIFAYIFYKYIWKEI